MRLSIIAAAVALAVSGGQALAQTASTDKDKRTMEQNASPSNDTKQDEERTSAHSQPDTPASTGGSGASQPAKRTHGDSDQSRRGNTDSSTKPNRSAASDASAPNPTGATLPRSVR